MKRVRIELAQIAERENLIWATWRAAKGKRDRHDVQAWLQHLEHNVAHLRVDILSGRAPQGGFRQFTIHDPKRRLIHAADFPDRVLHHAIMRHAGPVLDRALVAHSYACVSGRGVHAAVRQVQHNLRCYPWFVKIDIDGYFPSIEHARLLPLLEQRFKGEGFIRLLHRVVAANGGEPGRGLPIGSLTSQHFANLYLDGCDRRLAADSRVCANLRYMDDILWWCESRQHARDTLNELRSWLLQARGLHLHDNLVINRSEHGVAYCGFRLTPAAIRLSRRRQRRYRQQRAELDTLWAQGALSTSQLQRGYDSLHATTLPADALGFRWAELQRHPAPEGV